MESESEFPLYLREQRLLSESVQVKIAVGVTEMEIVYVPAVPHVRRIVRAFPRYRTFISTLVCSAVNDREFIACK